MEIIKSIELLGEFKSNEIYYFYKTSSSEANLEILSHLKKYQSSIDFFYYYTDTDIKSLNNVINELDRNLMNIFNEESNKFSTNTDKYISKISKIILTLNLIQKNQEILNSIISKTKNYFNEIFSNFKYDTIYQEKILFLINNLQYNFSSDFRSSIKKISRISTKDNSCSSQISSQDFSYQKTEKKNKIKNNDINEVDNFFANNQRSIINEECLSSDISTPKFQKLEKKIKERQPISNIKNSNQDIYTQKESTLTLSEMIFAPCPDDNIHSSNRETRNKSDTNIKLKKRKNSFIPDRSDSNNMSVSLSNHKQSFHKSLNNDEDIKMYSDLLILIKKLYRFCLINSEERIKFKKIVIEKPKPIFEFYSNIYKNHKTDYKKLAGEFKKLFKIDEK